MRAETAAPLGAPAWAAKAAVRFTHVSLALSSAFKSTAVALLASLPHHQQLLLCAMALRGRAVAANAEADAVSRAAAKAAKEEGPKPGAKKKGGRPRKFPLPAAGASATSGAPPSASTTIRELYTDYRRLCVDQQVRPLATNEVLPLCHSLASCGVLGVGSAKVASRPRPAATSDEQLRLHVWMCISEAEIRTATAELRFFRAILGDGAPPP